jgi:hypothetical protein
VLEKLLQLDLWLIHTLNGLAGNYFVDHTINTISGNNFIKGTVLLAAYWFYWFGEEPSQVDVERNILIRGIVSGLVAIVIARLLASFSRCDYARLPTPLPTFRSTWSGEQTIWRIGAPFPVTTPHLSLRSHSRYSKYPAASRIVV